MSIDPSSVAISHLRPGDAGWLIQRHAEYYSEVEGFDASFEPLVASILVDFMNKHDPKTERAFIARTPERRLGSIFCVQSGEHGVAKLRLFFVEPDTQGTGLGQRLLSECLGFAGGARYQKMRLWTHESHRAACALYEKNGFRCENSFPVHSFGVDLVEQTWEIDLF